MACYELDSPIQLFDKEIFEDVLSIFITSSILKLIQGMLFDSPMLIYTIIYHWKGLLRTCPLFHLAPLPFSFCPFLVLAAILDIAFTWKARKTMEHSEKVKQVVKLVVAVIWTIVLPTCYAHSRRKYTCFSSESGNWLEEWCLSPYMVAVGVYLVPNAMEMVLFFVPAVRKYLEISNSRMFFIFSWTQVSSS